MRGNRRASGGDRSDRGSIPARAGEPIIIASSVQYLRVYPRACGGTPPRPSTCQPCPGLSPRVRGNPARNVEGHLRRGSIPARAGEPGLDVVFAVEVGVYPRACGGTGPMLAPAVPGRGLSPRVRGNPRQDFSAAFRKRSIPARAGEPRPPDPATGRNWVYPRACGGTLVKPLDLLGYQGLSPRVRGNRLPAPVGRLDDGSIPARAGEPSSSYRLLSFGPVYPRACGGTGFQRFRR